MKNRIILLIAVIFAISIIVVYAYCFRRAGLSKDTSDWGAFGTYAALGLSGISISLIFITYREQKNSNNISRTELHIATLSNTLIDLTERNQSKFKTSFEKLCKHFNTHTYDISNFKFERIIKVLKYYYITASENSNSEIQNQYFRYMYHCFYYIVNNKHLQKEDVLSRIAELSFTIPEHIRIMFFCWMLIHQRDDIKDYYSYGMFFIEDTCPKSLKDMIAYVGTEVCPPPPKNQKVNPDNLILDDFPDEQFYDSYCRLNR